MKATTKNRWAPIIKNNRGEHIAFYAIASTQKRAQQKFLGGPANHPLAKPLLKGVRFARVTITEQ